MAARRHRAGGCSARRSVQGAEGIQGRRRPRAPSVRSLADAIQHLKRLSRPFLNWAGKAERLSFDVPTLPLFVHERLSTKAVVDTLIGHRKDRQIDMYDLFGDPKHSDRRSDAARVRVPGQVGQPADPRRLARRDEFAAAVRGHGRAGPDDPGTMAVDHRDGDDVPAWFVDIDYNGLCFHGSQAFFPRK